MVLSGAIADRLVALDSTYSHHRSSTGSIYVKLKRAIYGCIESSNLWYENLKNILTIKLGFTANVKDTCVFNKETSQGQLSISIYVDDLLVTCRSKVLT